MSTNKYNYVIVFCNHGINTQRKWSRLGPNIIYSPLVSAQAILCHTHDLKSVPSAHQLLQEIFRLKILQRPVI